MRKNQVEVPVIGTYQRSGPSKFFCSHPLLCKVYKLYNGTFSEKKKNTEYERDKDVNIKEALRLHG